jgi:YidC/Oxa1 family membrane protein insertase
MPKNNLFIFIVVAALIIGGWYLLQVTWLAKPAGEQTAQDLPKKASPKETPEDKAKELARQQAHWEEEAMRFAGGAATGAAPPKAIPEAPAGPPIALGDPDPKYNYFIHATVTPRGGGIQSLTLPKFQRADENGRPVYNQDGSPTPLQLIQEDFVVSSFLMYHYPVPDKDVCVVTLGQKAWKVESSSTNADLSTITLSCEDIPGYPELRIVKTYSLKPREYHIGLTVRIEDNRDPKGASKDVRPFRYQLAGSHGTPVEGEWYTSVYRSPMIGSVNEKGRLERDLSETQQSISIREGGNRFPLAELGDNRIQYAGVSTQYFSSLIVVDTEQSSDPDQPPRPQNVFAYCRPTLESEESQGTIERIDRTDPNRVRINLSGKGDLVLLPRTRALFDKEGLKTGDRVWVSWYDPLDGRKELVATHIRRGEVRRRQLDDITVRGVSNILELEPGKKIEHRFLLYHGPAKVRLLYQFTGDQAVDPALVERYVDTFHLETLTDYRSAGFFGTVSSTIMWTDLLILTTRFMHWLLDKLHWVVQNYGISIILLTVLVRGAMFPISRRSALLSLRMQALAPEMRKLQEKYKDDPQAKTAAIMELYRKHGVNPFGSCLPLLLQMPFFLGLYYCLQESIHFRLASFLWIDNLAAPDMLIPWGQSIPLISDPDNMSGSFFSFLYLGPYFNLLPVLAVALMLVQQKMMTPPPADEQQEMQQKMMKYMFIFIGIMFYKVAAGLCVYFIVTSLWGLCERKMLPKKVIAAPLATAPPVATTPVKGKGKPVKKEKKPETALQKVKDWWAEVLKQAQKK